MATVYYTFLDSPVGRLLLAGTDEGLRTIRFPKETGASKPERGWIESKVPFREAVRQLQEYFAGMRRTFDLRLAPEGTPFQHTVWKAVAAISFGTTASYAEIARRIGKPKALRAVGGANGRNPIPIVVPCHRVIGSDGSLTGFGGGLATKQKLLDLERKHASGSS